MKKNILQLVVCFALLVVILLVVPGCSGVEQLGDNIDSEGQENNSDTGSEVYVGGVSYNLMEGISGGRAEGKEVDDTFIYNQMKLDLKLFQQSVAATPDKNTLISPLSIQLALAMAANGADGNTKAEMEELLAGTYGLEDLNKYLYTYVNGLPTAEDYKVNIANSIWFRADKNRLSVEEDFLQTNANYYSAQLNASPFDGNTVTDINNWVNENTDGMIKEILKEIKDEAIMYLINAISFDAKWSQPYSLERVYESEFSTFDGTKQDIEMMYADEWNYLEDDKATGFVKSYKDNKYSFVAILPKEEGEEAFYDYIESLDVEKIQSMLDNQMSRKVSTALPKFSYEYSLSMVDVLKTLGMKDAFSGGAADFSKMAQSAYGNIYISEVAHKTFIQVDELGTRAGAVTMVEMSDECEPGNSVILDRPFVYMIIDNETQLPIFIGTVITFE